MEEGLIPWAQTLISFEQLISQRAVVPHFQPIVTMDCQSVQGYEVLARSDLPQLRSPAAMFDAAERLDQQATLSELMRDEAARVASGSQPDNIKFYVNTHPCEFGTDRLMHALEDLANNYPDLAFMIEVHEAAVTEVRQMKLFRDQIATLGMQLSYDDFGAGQGRLLELVEVPPDVLKFDMKLIREIDSASSNRQELLRSLVRIAKNSGSTPLAEGVETQAEHAVCVDLDFELGQGYLYGHPRPQFANV